MSPGARFAILRPDLVAAPSSGAGAVITAPHCPRTLGALWRVRRRQLHEVVSQHTTVRGCVACVSRRIRCNLGSHTRRVAPPAPPGAPRHSHATPALAPPGHAQNKASATSGTMADDASVTSTDGGAIDRARLPRHTGSRLALVSRAADSVVSCPSPRPPPPGDPRKRGHWTDAEHATFLKGLEEHGTDYALLSRIVRGPRVKGQGRCARPTPPPTHTHLAPPTHTRHLPHPNRPTVSHRGPSHRDAALHAMVVVGRRGLSAARSDHWAVVEPHHHPPPTRLVVHRLARGRPHRYAHTHRSTLSS